MKVVKLKNFKTLFNHSKIKEFQLFGYVSKYLETDKGVIIIVPYIKDFNTLLLSNRLRGNAEVFKTGDGNELSYPSS